MQQFFVLLAGFLFSDQRGDHSKSVWTNVTFEEGTQFDWSYFDAEKFRACCNEPKSRGWDWGNGVPRMYHDLKRKHVRWRVHPNTLAESPHTSPRKTLRAPKKLDRCRKVGSVSAPRSPSWKASRFDGRTPAVAGLPRNFPAFLCRLGTGLALLTHFASVAIALRCEAVCGSRM